MVDLPRRGVGHALAHVGEQELDDHQPVLAVTADVKDAAFERDGAVDDDGRTAKPARRVSSSPGGRAREHSTMRAATGSSQRWMTHSPFAIRFAAVSFGVPSSRSAGASTAIGGSTPMTLKKENGAALTRPAASTVVTSAMGLGTTSPASRR